MTPAVAIKHPGGRPTSAALTASLDASRRVNANLRDELRAMRRECVDFATDARAHASRIYLAVLSDRPDLALHEAAAISTACDRHLRQRGGAA